VRLVVGELLIRGQVPAGPPDARAVWAATLGQLWQVVDPPGTWGADHPRLGRVRPPGQRGFDMVAYSKDPADYQRLDGTKVEW
jgi:hypothetical protein